MRLIVTIFILLPAVFLAGLQFLMTVDAEMWLAEYFHGFARPDAFSGVNRILRFFVALFCATSILAAYFVTIRRSEFLILLATAPSLATLVYVTGHGIADPSWFQLLALLSIGMLVGVLITSLWAI